MNGIATHGGGEPVGYFRMEADQTYTVIFCGKSNVVLLTVTLMEPVGSAVEVCANGHLVTEPVLTRDDGPQSRTWLLEGVHSIELKNPKGMALFGRYVISVLA
jgi:hypothetical protein